MSKSVPAIHYVRNVRRNVSESCRRRPGSSLHLEQLESRALLAADFALLKDINTTPASSAMDGYFTQGVGIGDDFYFVALDEVNSATLWKTDGSAAGTLMLSDQPFGGHYPQLLTKVGNRLVYNGYASEGNPLQRQLWASDGTVAGTRPLLTPDGSTIGGDPDYFAVMGDTLYFNAEVPANLDATPIAGDFNGKAIWKTDGTSAQPLSHSFVGRKATLNGDLYFAGFDSTHGIELWRSDGTVAGTARFAELDTTSFEYNGTSYPNGSYPDNMVNAGGGTLYFTTWNFFYYETSLWKTDGTAAGTTKVDGPAPQGVFLGPSSLVSRGAGTIYYLADDGVHGGELWTSDGTAAGTTLVKDVQPGPGGSGIDAMTMVNGTLFFTADDGEHGVELWKSDGTDAGTTRVTDFADEPGLGIAAPIAVDAFRRGPSFTVLNDHVYFIADDGSRGRELWRSDGTPAGTMMVHDTVAGAENIIGTHLGQIFFNADDGLHGSELWKSNGTDAGTVPVADLAPGNRGTIIGDLRTVGDRTYFQVSAQIGGPTETWSTDGTETATQPSDWDIPANAVALDSHFVFASNDLEHGNELWISDGTPGGAHLLKDLNNGAASSTPMSFHRMGELVVFFADDGVNGMELWRTDGTADGTFLVADTNLGTFGSDPYSGVSTDGHNVYFRSYSYAPEGGANAASIWQSDGTADGTRPIWTITSDLLYALAPQVVGAVDGTVLFRSGDELWASDGTDGGTQMVLTAKFNTGVLNRGLSTTKDVLLAVNDGVHGTELWASDGTVAGTRLVREINPGSAGALINLLYADGNLVYFSAYDPDHGVELWQSDGTHAGTRLVADISPGPVSSGPRQATKLNGRLIVSIATAETGRELWIEQPTLLAVRIDELAAALRAQDHSEDLTGDNLVTFEDLTYLVEDQLHLPFGDANTDGVFDSSDLTQVMQHGQYEDEVLGNSGWEDGDFNGDGDFTTEDIVLAFQRGMYVL